MNDGLLGVKLVEKGADPRLDHFLCTHCVLQSPTLPLMHTERVKHNVTSAWCSAKNGNNCYQGGCFTQKAEAAADANNGEDVHFLHCDASRVLCGWGLTLTNNPNNDLYKRLLAKRIFLHTTYTLLLTLQFGQKVRVIRGWLHPGDISGQFPMVPKEKLLT